MLSTDQMRATLALYGWYPSGEAYRKDAGMWMAWVSPGSRRVLLSTPIKPPYPATPLSDQALEEIFNCVLEYEHAATKTV